MIYEALVIGAGINGLATAYQLQQRGLRKVRVLEQFPPDHSQGSSHGRSRITRSSYNTPKYVEMMQCVHDHCWPEWEKAAGRSLRHKTPGIFFGPGLKEYQDSLHAVPEVLPHIEEISAEQARRRFPPFQFPDSPTVVVDHTCALIAAHQTMDFLRSQLEIDWEVQVQRLECGQHLQVHTQREVYRCQRLVITAGAWIRQLLGEDVAPLFRVAHQDVGYFDLEVPMDVGQFPVWVYAGQAADDSFYGLPRFERAGVKLARHRTGAHHDDPNREIPESLPTEVSEDLMGFARSQWGCQPPLVGYDPCLYTNTINEDFLLDCWPQDPRVWLGAACSGHGFKFAPFTGRVLADLCLDGSSSLEAFERHRHHFSWSALPRWTAS